MTVTCEPKRHASNVVETRPPQAGICDELRWRRLQQRTIEYLPHLAYGALDETPLDLDSLNSGSYLLAETEAVLFRQMNLAAYRATQWIVQYDCDGGVDQLAEAERLADRADQIRNTLAIVFSKLALSIVSQFASARHPLDELLSEAHATLLRAIARFDPDRGFRFSTYATHALRRRILRYLHDRQRESRRFVNSPHDAFGADTRHWTTAYERKMNAAVAQIERMLLQLPPRERYIVRSRFGWGREFDTRTLQQIADELGVSRERVRQLEARALRKLRDMANELEFAAT